MGAVELPPPVRRHLLIMSVNGYSISVSFAEFACWGLMGGVSIELLDLAAQTKKQGKFPWLVPGQMNFWAYLYCALTRPVVGAVVAVALGLAGQITGAWGLLVVGAGAPLVIQNASSQVAAGFTQPLEKPITVESLSDAANSRGSTDFAAGEVTEEPDLRGQEGR